MFLKASSTLVESKAEVSINDRVFFSEDETHIKFKCMFIQESLDNDLDILQVSGLSGLGIMVKQFKKYKTGFYFIYMSLF